MFWYVVLFIVFLQQYKTNKTEFGISNGYACDRMMAVVFGGTCKTLIICIKTAIGCCTWELNEPCDLRNKK